MRYLEWALDIKKENHIETDVQMAMILYDIGQCLRESGRPQEAAQHVWKALKIAEAKSGPNSLEVRGRKPTNPVLEGGHDRYQATMLL